MSQYTELAMERRRRLTPEGRPVYNCCQAVVSVFALDAGFDEEACLRAATFFRGGMQQGSVCGAITGGLLALGLAGVEDAAAANALFRKVREHHEGLVECRDLLRVSAERGEVKKAHCDAMICECVGEVEALLRERGRIP